MHQIGANGIYFVDVKVNKAKGGVQIRVNLVNKGFKNEYNEDQMMPWHICSMFKEETKSDARDWVYI